MPSWSWNVTLAAVPLIAASTQASAQMQPPQPYAGQQNREIKSLSPQDRADLTSGRGMGLALPAELNGYPGPAHVLDLVDQLGLTEQQRTSVKQLFDSMKAEAIPLGQKLIAAERDLNREFAERTITPERLKAATAAIGEIRGELRNTHLKYHLSTAALLSQDQIKRYVELRGYARSAVAGSAAPGPAHGAMHGPMHPMMGSTGN